MLTRVPAGVNDANAEGRAIVFLVVTRAFDCGHFGYLIVFGNGIVLIVVGDVI